MKKYRLEVAITKIGMLQERTRVYHSDDLNKLEQFKALYQSIQCENFTEGHNDFYRYTIIETEKIIR